MRLGLGQGLGGQSQSSGGLSVLREDLMFHHKYNLSPVHPLSGGATHLVLDNKDYIEIAHDASLDIGRIDSSIAAWIYIDDVSTANQGVFSKHEEETARWYIRVKSDGTVSYYGKAMDDQGTPVVQTITNGNHTIYNSQKIVDKKWYHIAISVDASESVTFYINGAKAGYATGGVHNLDCDNDAPIRIGGRGYSGSLTDPFGGYMCNVGFWGRQLTLADVKSIMWKQYVDLSDTEKLHLKGWWNLDDAAIPTGNGEYTKLYTGFFRYKDVEANPTAITNISTSTEVVDFVTSKDFELGSDIFGGEGTFTTDTGYWTLNNDTRVEDGLVITDSGSGGGNYNAIGKSGILTDDKIYKLSWDIIDKGIVDGQLRFNWAKSDPALGDSYPKIWSQSDGTGSFHCYFQTTGIDAPTGIILYAAQTGTGDYVEIKLDNLVCQEVLNAGELK